MLTSNSSVSLIFLPNSINFNDFSYTISSILSDADSDDDEIIWLISSSSSLFFIYFFISSSCNVDEYQPEKERSKWSSKLNIIEPCCNGLEEIVLSFEGCGGRKCEWLTRFVKIRRIL